MSMRGVFFVLFLLIACSSPTDAWQVGGELVGLYGTAGIDHGLSLTAEKKWSFLTVQGGWEGEWVNLTPGLTHSLNWQVDLGPLVFSGNRAHHTSGDLFRLVHKDNFQVGSTALLFLSDGVQLGLLRRVPLKNLDHVDAWFCASTLELGPFSLQGMELQFSGYKEAGEAQVLQLQGEIENWGILAGLGWQTNSSGIESQAKVGEIRKKSGFLEGTASWQWVEPGFMSPLAKTNKYTPDRQGWKLETTANFSKFQLSFNRRRHVNVAGTKDYNQLSWLVGSLDEKVSVQWRLEPTEAFIISAKGEGVEAQFDCWNGTLRWDWQFKSGLSSLRWDLQRRIVRFEFKHKGILDWRAIAKYDFLQYRHHYFLSTSYKAKTTELRLELGSYDRGNLMAGFNNPPSLSISWGWKF